MAASPSVASRVRRYAGNVGLVVQAVAAGAPGAIATFALMLAVNSLSQNAFPDRGESTVNLFAAGVRVAIAMLCILGTPILVPAIWRRLSDTVVLEGVALAAVQLEAVGIGLLFGSERIGIHVTWALAAVGAIAWLTWTRRWRGRGLAPYVLAGVLRPDLAAGQLWFAIVPGHKETKVRPVLILGPAPDDDLWNVAYCTTRPPAEHLAERYLPAPVGTIRGIDRDNWLNLKDLRSLRRGQFRTYAGMAPARLYRAAIEAYGLPEDPQAWLVKEGSDGKEITPLHAAILWAMGTRHDSARPPETTVTWGTLRAILRLPVTGGLPGKGRSSKSGPE